MKSTQGIILMMFAVLILWLTWSSRSPLRNSGTAVPSKPSGDTIKPGPDGKPTADNAPHFPVIPADILGPYTDCKTRGGTWDFTSNTCIWKT